MLNNCHSRHYYYTYISSNQSGAGKNDCIKGALYRIQILCRRYTFWSYPAGLTIADPPG